MRLLGFSRLRVLFQSKDTVGFLLRGSFGSFLVRCSGVGIAFSLQILLARMLGSGQFGIYIYTLTWLSFLVLLSKLGVDTATVRFIAAYNALQRWGLLRGFLVLSAYFVFLGSILIGAVSAVSVWMFHERIGLEGVITFRTGLLLLPVLALSDLRQSALRAFKQVVKAEAPDSILKPLLLSVFLVATFYIFPKYPLQAVNVMWLNLIAVIITFICGMMLLFKAIPQPVHYAKPTYEISNWVQVSLPLFLVSGMGLIASQIDTVMLGALLGTEEAGVYAVASRLVQLVLFGLVSVNSIIAPLISELYTQKKTYYLQKILRQSAAGVLGFTVVASLLLVAKGQAILLLFGKEFIGGYIPLIVLIGGQVINSISGSVGILMTMTEHQNQAAKIFAIVVSLNVILNLMLIPKLGMLGAAIATATTTVIWNISMLVYVRKKMGLNPTILP